MITADGMREIADKVIQEKEKSIFTKYENIIEYIEQSIRDEALKGNKFLCLYLDDSDICSPGYVFPNGENISDKDLRIILEKFEQNGFSISFSQKELPIIIIEWKK